MYDLEKLASKGSPSAAVGTFQPDVRDRAMCNAIKSGALKVGFGVVEAVCGVFLVGQALAVLSSGARAPTGNRRPNRNITSAIGGQQFVVGGEFDPSAAVRELNRALQNAKRSRPTPNWGERTRTIFGLYTPLPVTFAYIDGKFDLAKAITEKNKMALQNPCEPLPWPTQEPPSTSSAVSAPAPTSETRSARLQSCASRSAL